MIIDSSYFGYVSFEISYTWGIGKADFEKSLESLRNQKDKYYQCDRVKVNGDCSEKEYIIFEK